MSPLMGLAVSLMPDLIRLIGSDASGTLANRVGDIIEAAAGTKDLAAASERLRDPALAATAKIRLAELALDAQRAQSAAQGGAGGAADDASDASDARATLAALAATGSDVAWGAPVVSVIVALGFFGTLGIAVFGGRFIADTNKEITYTLIGTMATAFATMISFWLGSSQGSRNKDVIARQVQLVHANQTSHLLAQLKLPERRAEPAAPAAVMRVAPPAAPQSNFAACLHEVLCLEGGYSDDPRDPGGPTNFGISRAEWADVCKRPISSITPADMQKLTLQQASSVYRKFYWNAMCCEDLQRGVDLMVFQFGVNAGIDASAQVLQELCGVVVDGIIGPLTVAAANRRPPVQLIQDLAAAQLARYRTFAEWGTYGEGWTNRVENAKKIALAMAG